jgi:hypothetical protein
MWVLSISTLSVLRPAVARTCPSTSLSLDTTRPISAHTSLSALRWSPCLLLLLLLLFV